MIIYRGRSRRQVGGNIWSTIQRGAKPFLKLLWKKLSPHAMKGVNTLAQSAGRVAVNAMLNPRSTKNNIKEEAKLLKGRATDYVKEQAADGFSRFKRKIFSDEKNQYGSGRKRRKLSKKKVVKRKKKNCKTSPKKKIKKKQKKSKKISKPIKKGKIKKKKKPKKLKTNKRKKKKTAFII